MSHERRRQTIRRCRAAASFGPIDVAQQAGPYGIRVNCLAPETILTERNDQRIPDDQKQSLIGTHPLRRLGTPEDVANAALFLVSNESDWMTGLIVDVAGGAVMV